MKKEYTKPSMKAYKVKPSQIICGSGGSSPTLSSGSGDEPQTEENTYGTTTYKGIWGE